MSESAEPTNQENPVYEFTHDELVRITEARRKFITAMELRNIAHATGASPEVVEVLDNEWRRLMDKEYEIQQRLIPVGHVPGWRGLLPFEKPHIAFQRAVDEMKTRFEATNG